MKKSEMIELMNKTFKENYRGHTYEQVNEIILEKMEEAGMLPPSIATEGFLANLHKRHKDKHLIWEPEDG